MGHIPPPPPVNRDGSHNAPKPTKAPPIGKTHDHLGTIIYWVLSTTSGAALAWYEHGWEAAYFTVCTLSLPFLTWTLIQRLRRRRKNASDRPDSLYKDRTREEPTRFPKMKDPDEVLDHVKKDPKFTVGKGIQITTGTGSFVERAARKNRSAIAKVIEAASFSTREFGATAGKLAESVSIGKPVDEKMIAHLTDHWARRGVEIKAIKKHIDYQRMSDVYVVYLLPPFEETRTKHLSVVVPHAHREQFPVMEHINNKIRQFTKRYSNTGTTGSG